jgi:hypothetical protein
MPIPMAESRRVVIGRHGFLRERSPMRWLLATVLVVSSFAAQAGLNYGVGPSPGLTGNDTGGIIQWTPDVDHFYRDIAAEHCARWNRVAQITSAHRWYGEYIGFVCLVDRYQDPRKAWLYGR